MHGLYLTMTFPMTLTDYGHPGFQGDGIFAVEYLKTVRFRDNTTKEY